MLLTIFAFAVVAVMSLHVTMPRPARISRQVAVARNHQRQLYLR
ncbi:hypothetical protein [Antarctobacter jejuensis]